MIIGLCGDGFADVRRALRSALPHATLVDIPIGGDVPASGLGVDVLVPLGARVDAGLMDATGPRIIQQFGVGVQGVDQEAAQERGIPVQSVPAANSVAVAELAVMLLLMLLRRYPHAQQSITDRRVGEPSGATLAGKTVTVLGAGAVGAEVISRLTAFGATSLAVGRRSLSDYPGLTGLIAPGDYYPTSDLDRALAASDALVVCCPLTDQTRDLVNDDAIKAMPAGGHIVNVARAGVVERLSILRNLQDGHLAGAGLDVTWDEPVDPDDELFTHNVIVTPHIAGVTSESYASMAEGFVTQLHAAGIRTD